jgi:BirA family biotin operon repressor/biotin-[acetyl-CoA-carboxylase] ligase
VNPPEESTLGEQDGLTAERVAELLAGSPLGRPLHFFSSIDSTNSFLRAVPAESAEHGALAVADHQSAGRGRFARRWADSPGRSLLFSLLLDAPRPIGSWPLLTLGMAVSVCRATAKGGVAARIRWPNDVLIEEKKICGILMERAAHAGRLVLGVGVNVSQEQGEWPAPLRDRATSLRAASGRLWDRAALLAAILADFAGVFERWRREDDGGLLDEVRPRMLTLGRFVRLRAHERTVEGVMMDLDRDGSLVLRDSTGILSRWHSADVEESRWDEK